VERVLRVGPGGAPEAPTEWYLLLGASSRGASMVTTTAWLVGIDAAEARIGDRFDVTTDRASAGFVIRYQAEHPDRVELVGVALPPAPPRDPGAWGFVMCQGGRFNGWSSFASLPAVAPSGAKLDRYRPSLSGPAPTEARRVAWFGYTPCFHAFDPKPRPYKRK
jgi:hypothetical protein